MCIYFVRHGMTAEDLPDRNKISGWNSVPLNTEGRVLAAKAAVYLKDHGITNILASDTLRAQQTAKIIGQRLDLPVVLSERLRSWNMGAMQGLLVETAKPFLKFFQEHPDVTVPQGEKFGQFYRRFRAAFNALVSYSRRFPQSEPAVVTHSQGLDLIPWFIADKEPGQVLESLGSHPGDIFKLVTEGDLQFRKVRV
jgi:broad specificity phosphatase PhoE